MNDSGFLVGGSSWSIPSGNKTSFNFGLTDYWIIRLDAAGNKLCEQPYGGTGRNELYAAWIVGNETVVAGYSESRNTGNKTSPGIGAWFLGLNSDGENFLGDLCVLGVRLLSEFPGDGSYLSIVSGHREHPIDTSGLLRCDVVLHALPRAVARDGITQICPRVRPQRRRVLDLVRAARNGLPAHLHLADADGDRS
jgi:hypothetical protein